MPHQLEILIHIIHVMAGIAWFGEVVVINFVLIPTVKKYEGEAKKQFVNNLFPKVFRLASVLSAITAITGVILLYDHVGFEIGELFEMGTWGISIFIGGLLGAILTIFHFFIENNMAKKVGVGNPNIEQEAVEDVHLKLKLIPRLGLVVITTIVFMMLNAKLGLIAF